MGIMKKIRSIDYFRKPGEHALATRTGGIVSILSITTIIVLSVI